MSPQGVHEFDMFDVFDVFDIEVCVDQRMSQLIYMLGLLTWHARPINAIGSAAASGTLPHVNQAEQW